MCIDENNNNRNKTKKLTIYGNFLETKLNLTLF
jgi:hypothetical protein